MWIYGYCGVWWLLWCGRIVNKIDHLFYQGLPLAPLVFFLLFLCWQKLTGLLLIYPRWKRSWLLALILSTPLWALLCFFLGEYCSVILMSSLATIFFWGGWLPLCGDC